MIYGKLALIRVVVRSDNMGRLMERLADLHTNATGIYSPEGDVEIKKN